MGGTLGGMGALHLACWDMIQWLCGILNRWPSRAARSTTIKAYLRETFGYELGFIGPVIAILVMFSVFFMVMAVVVLRTINFQKR